MTLDTLKAACDINGLSLQIHSPFLVSVTEDGECFLDFNLSPQDFAATQAEFDARVLRPAVDTLRRAV